MEHILTHTVPRLQLNQTFSLPCWEVTMSMGKVVVGDDLITHTAWSTCASFLSWNSLFFFSSSLFAFCMVSSSFSSFSKPSVESDGGKTMVDVVLFRPHFHESMPNWWKWFRSYSCIGCSVSLGQWRFCQDLGVPPSVCTHSMSLVQLMTATYTWWYLLPWEILCNLVLLLWIFNLQSFLLLQCLLQQHRNSIEPEREGEGMGAG